MATGRKTGKELNKKLLEQIDEEIERLFEKGQNQATLSNDVIDVLEDGSKFISREDLEKYDALSGVKNILEFTEYDEESTYDIPGVHIPDGSTYKVSPLYVRKNDVHSFISYATDVEENYGIIFPSQLFQEKRAYIGKFIDDARRENFLPEIKLMSQTDEEYENYLENFYGPGAKVPMDDGLGGRRPYIHEMIDFKKGNTYHPEEPFVSEYYQYRLDEDRLNQLGQLGSHSSSIGAHNNPIPDGEDLTVLESEDYERTPLRQKIGCSLGSFENYFKNSANFSKLRIFAIGGSGIGIVGYLAYLFPPYAAFAGAAIGIGVLYKFITSARKKVREAEDDYLFGPPLPTSEPQTNNPSPTGTQTGQAQQQPPSQPSSSQGQQQSQPQPGNSGQDQSSPIPSELDGFLHDSGFNIQVFREIERRKKVAESELLNLVVGSSEYIEKENEILKLSEQLKEQLLIIASLTEDFVNSYQTSQRVGRTR